MTPESPSPELTDTDSSELESTLDTLSSERALLDVTSLEEWRSIEFERLARLRTDAVIGDSSYLKEFSDGIEGSLDEYLQQHGVDKESPHFDKLWALYRDASPDRIHGDEWYIPPAHQYGVLSTNRVSARENAIRLLSEAKQKIEHTDGVLQYRIDIEKIRHTYSEKLAERSKKMGLFERPRTRAEIAAVREELAEYIGALATEMMDDLEAQGIREDLWADTIDIFIASQMAGVVNGMEAARADDFLSRNKVVKYGLEKWASWASPNLERNEGESRARHFGRSVLASVTSVNTWKKAGVFGVIGGTVGALTVPLVGLVGGGAFVVAGATLLSRQIARGLVGAKLDRAANAETIAHTQAAEMTTKMQELSEATHHDMLELAENMAEGYRKHNRNRLLGGMAVSLAVGGGAGVLINSFFDSSMLFGKLYDVFRHSVRLSEEVPPIPATDSDYMSSGRLPDTSPPPPEVAPPPPPLPETVPPGNGAGDMPPKPPSRIEVIDEYLEGRDAAGKISGGEGWLQTFKELGIAQGDRRAFLDEYGDELLKKFPEVTYRMPNGDPGILMTEDGKMPDEVLQYIVDHANKEGMLKNPLDFSDVEGSGGKSDVVEKLVEREKIRASGVIQEPGPGSGSGLTIEAANTLISTEGLVPANTVSNGEGLFRTFGELKKAGVIDIPSQKYAEFMKIVGPKLAERNYGGEPVTFWDRYHHEWRMYKPTSGRLHPEAIRMIERLARQNAYRLAA